MPVVISREHDRFAGIPEPFDQPTRFVRRSSVVDHVAYDYKMARLILRDQLHQSFLDRSHAPQRHQPTRRALAQFIPEVQIRDREPTLPSMKKREPTIE